ncbi:hypothetical protein FBU30_001518 [Linnemannia zychae]|nr:hypothetical protein FBU30_001518 [Linnemannia zychae]
MKFITALTILATIATASVFAQSTTDGSAPTPCMSCLKASIESLPACQSLTIVIGDMNPASDPAYAKCLCSSLDGAWVDKCISTCSQDILSFKNAYSENIQAAGLRCSPVPTFVSTPLSK